MFNRRLIQNLLLYSRSCSRSYSTGSFLGCYDVVIIGGGIVGAATARQITLTTAELTCAIVEKENSLGCHQSSHNSGVVHAGIYYKPGTARAEMCTQGMHLAYKYFDKKGIPYKKIGKLIVATDVSQIPCLNELYVRGQMNNVPDLKMIEADQIKEIEPACTGVKALHSPHTGIVNWDEVTQNYGEDFKEHGGDIHLNFEVSKLYSSPESDHLPSDLDKYPITVETKQGKTVKAGFVLSCAGLYADQVASMTGGAPDPAIVPIRGEYLLLSEKKTRLIRGNIYPVPNPQFPFLGVHFTPRMDGSVWLGPNAILAFRREGYSYSDISMNEMFTTMKYEGFQKLVMKHMNFGMNELMKSIFTNLQVKELQKFVPTIGPDDVRRGPTGVRAQALSPSGELIEDFVFETVNSRVVHCRNAPSPAATSSLAIARSLANKVLAML